MDGIIISREKNAEFSSYVVLLNSLNQLNLWVFPPTKSWFTIQNRGLGVHHFFWNLRVVFGSHMLHGGGRENKPLSFQKKKDEPITPYFGGEIMIFSLWKWLFWVPLTPSHPSTPTPTHNIKINLVTDLHFKCSFHNIFWRI